MDKSINMQNNNLNFKAKKDIIKKNVDIKETVASFDEFRAFFKSVIGIYSDFEFTQKISNCAKETQGKIKAIGNSGFCGGQNLVEFIPRRNISNAKLVLERIDKKNPLLNYDYKVFEHNICRNYVSVQLPEKQSFMDYTDKFDINEINFKEREKLYENISKLAEKGITISPFDLYYNPKEKDFKIMSFKNISPESFYDFDEKNAYLKFFAKFCKIIDKND